MTAIQTKPLKWAGSKTHLVERIRPLFPSGKRWVEPFCGSLALPLALKPRVALLSDINPHLINFWRWVQWDGIVRHVKFKNDSAHYYECRDRFNAIAGFSFDYNPEAAELFYYLNRTGFNGLCRFNKNGGFNVPFGSYKKINYRTDFTEFQSIMVGWDFVCADFRAIKKCFRVSDFIYADPPYHGTFTGYSAGGFGWDDQVTLAQTLVGYHAVVSNSWVPELVSLYQECGYRVESIIAPRSISCKGDREPVREMLALTNFEDSV